MHVCPGTCVQTHTHSHSFTHTDETQKIGKGIVMLRASHNEGLYKNIYPLQEGKTTPEINVAVSCESILNNLHFVTCEIFFPFMCL